MRTKISFISDTIGKDFYDFLRGYAMNIVIIGTCIWGILFGLSYFFHSGIISYFVNLANGFSLLFIGYVLALILLLDIEVSVEDNDDKTKTIKYKLTIVWFVLLILLGIIAIYYSNRYRNHYAFECETYLVDEKAGIYHLDWDIECSAAEEAESLEPMKGYQIDKSFRFCDACEELLDDAEAETGLVHARP